MKGKEIKENIKRRKKIERNKNYEDMDERKMKYKNERKSTRRKDERKLDTSIMKWIPSKPDCDDNLSQREKDSTSIQISSVEHLHEGQKSMGGYSKLNKNTDCPEKESME